MKPHSPSTILIGVDCACDPKNVGLARAEATPDERPHVTDVLRGSDVPSIAETLAAWIATAQHGLIALDAPLGWPGPLGAALHQHQAGEVLSAEPDQLFRRKTDREIKRRFNKTPLDVGADRIARTAHTALALLQEVRRITGRPIPLAWQPGKVEGICAIEVYPAGTLLAHKMPATGYKKSAQRGVREEILCALASRLRLPRQKKLLLDDADCLDAVVCLLAAADYLEGNAVPPSDIECAYQEGWIWLP